MILPPPSVAAGSATTVYNGTSSPSWWDWAVDADNSHENWASLIGIITAIVGNIMISFALNMQRYAHIRLSREWDEKERRRKRGSTRELSQAEIADERTKANLAREYHTPRHRDHEATTLEQDDTDEDYDAAETDPLIPPTSPTARHSSSRSRTVSGASGSESDSQAEEAFKQKSYLKSPYWWAGIILMTTGEAGNFLAYGFAPASIVSPLGVVALISNCIIAPFMLKEPFRMRDGFGVLVAVAGAVTVVLSASDHNPKLGPDEIWDLITTWEFETYLGITVAVIIGLMVASNRFGEKSILIDLGLVGLFGGYTALSTKGVASMLSYTLWRAITFPVTYLLVAVLVSTAIMQIKYVNRALQRFDATVVIPTQFVLFTLSVILGSAILYRDFERTPSGDAGKFIGGCFMTFLGVWFITSGRRRPGNGEEEDREPEPPEAISLVDGDLQHADGPHEQSTPSTRRTSALRAISPPIAIRRRDLSQQPSEPSTPRGPTAKLTPSSSIPDEPSPLSMNPWQNEHSGGAASSSSSPPLRPTPNPVLTRHPIQSTPLLPSEPSSAPFASASDPHLPPSTPYTPQRGISDTVISPISSSAGINGTTPSRLHRRNTAERLGLSARNSISAGPLLASPLSTSLTAVVADLKRGGSLRSHYGEGTPTRRRESVLGLGGGDNAVEDSEVLRRTESAAVQGDEDVERGEPVSRTRSLSGTLGGLWRGFRGVAGVEGGGTGGDVERGEERATRE